jgi:hypothetical protein
MTAQTFLSNNLMIKAEIPQKIAENKSGIKVGD